jgi:hypothetical protein
MPSTDLTLQVLIEIRDEQRKTREEMHQTRETLTQEIKNHGRRIDLSNRQMINEVARLTTEMGARHHDTGVAYRELRERVEQCERDILELRERG